MATTTYTLLASTEITSPTAEVAFTGIDGYSYLEFFMTNLAHDGSSGSDGWYFQVGDSGGYYPYNYYSQRLSSINTAAYAANAYTSQTYGRLLDLGYLEADGYTNAGRITFAQDRDYTGGDSRHPTLTSHFAYNKDDTDASRQHFAVSVRNNMFVDKIKFYFYSYNIASAKIQVYGVVK